MALKEAKRKTSFHETMQKILQYILPFELPQSFPNETSSRLYDEWDKPARLIQISAITFLTAVLYVFFTLLDKPSESVQMQALMQKIHLIAVAPLLLVISFLAYKKRVYNFVMLALFISPIIAISCHVYITSKLANFAPFLTEGYLAVFWIFIVSGMTFGYALVSAIISSTILIVSGFYLMHEPGVYTMHVFWIFCSFSFGFLGALIFDRSRKAIFFGQEKLHYLASTDVLTGAFNRNQMNSVLAEEIQRDLRYDKTFGFLMIDIDHFKRINDTYGHAVGDKVLQQTAHVLSKAIRTNDTLVRWGGEEFVVIAIEVDEKNIIQFCEKLRKKIEDEKYDVVGHVRVSIGVTLFRKNDTQDTLISRADKALYEAKEKGRNITVSIK